MALNLKTLATRSLSAAVFVVLLISSVLWNYFTFSAFFYIVSLIGLIEFYNIAEKLDSKPFKIAGLTFASIIYLMTLNYSLFGCNVFDEFVISKHQIFLWLLISVIFLIPVFALFSNRAPSIKDGLFTMFGIFYSVVPFVTLNLMASQNNQFSPKLILGIIFLIWSNDTFAYLGGSLFGKNKMIERISPGKTWEGTIFGVFVTFVISFIFKNYFENEFGLLWLIFGFFVPVLATIGDLIESMLKRQAQIKDSGNIMPGHGGVLDRFDSLIFVAPIVFISLNLFKIING
jgi:phosphatidate cytidylyltransferase